MTQKKPAPGDRTAGSLGAAPGSGTAALAELLRERPPRAGSLLVTLFGDALVPRGGRVRLQHLLKTCALFGIGAGRARTALTRLAAEGWFRRERQGRLSTYALSQEGRRWVERASRRIYRPPGWPRPLTWHLLIWPAPPPQELVRELGWLGFGRITAHVLIHPSPDQEALDAVLGAHGAWPEVLVLRDSHARAGPQALAALGARAWRLDALAADYLRYAARFGRLASTLDAPTARDALVARILAVHEYRRLVLRDPLLPRPLLPRGWPGYRAYEVLRSLYHRLLPASEAALDVLFPETRENGAEARAFVARRLVAAFGEESGGGTRDGAVAGESVLRREKHAGRTGDGL